MAAEVAESMDTSAVEEEKPKVESTRQNYQLDPIIKKNERLFAYYKLQPVIPESEFDDFVKTIQVDLPSSFRVQMSLPEAKLLDKYLHEHYFDKLPELHGVSVPKPIPFVPFGYQAVMPRHVMRSHPLLRDLHQFLVSETEIGALSRQEAVSMVPPLLLDIKPEHMVLDMCAAPGSKTSQLIELMHKDDPNPSGLIVANDIDYSRCYLLVHQTLKRMATANCVVTNCDASQMPTVVDENEKPVLFDRVLCDVICTGDGTFRKNPELWKTWDPQKALCLHRIQIYIAKRGLELLKVGGRMVYSTCSLNPIEDEAVISFLLRKFEGKVRLIDVSKELPDLKRIPGISSWKVIDKTMTEYPNMEAVPDAPKRAIKESMFPPTAEEAAKFNLQHGFRILPHYQNSGGFYVAVLEKTEAFDTDTNVWRPSIFGPPDRKRRRRMVREDPFNFLNEEESADIRSDLTEHFGLCSDFPFENMLIRSAEVEKKKVIYFANDNLKKFMKYNEKRFKIVNAGVGVAKRVDKVSVSKYRLIQDGLSLMTPFISKRIVVVGIPDAIKILEGSNDKHFVNLDELSEPGELKTLPCGGVVLKISNGEFSKEVCIWLGAHTVTAFITREEKIHCLVMLGHDAAKMRQQAQSSRQMKAQNQSGRQPLKKEEEKVEEENGVSNEVKQEVESEDKLMVKKEQE